MTAARPVPAARVYQLLLRLYPSRFYGQFAGDMSCDFRDGYAAARRRGCGTAVSFIVRCYTDLAVSLLSQWGRAESCAIAGTALSVSAVIWGGAISIAARVWPDAPATMWHAIQLAAFLTAFAMLTFATVLRDEGVAVITLLGLPDQE